MFFHDRGPQLALAADQQTGRKRVGRTNVLGARQAASQDLQRGVLSRPRQLPSPEPEVDGGYFGGYVKPANLKDDRVGQPLAKIQSGKRKVVIRERGGETLPALSWVRHVREGAVLINLDAV